MQTRYIIIIIMFAALLAGIGYWYFFVNPATDPPSSDDRENPLFIGQDDDAQQQNGDEAPQRDNGPPPERFAQITHKPIAGFTVIPTEISTTTEARLRYTERTTGHVYEYNIDTGKRRRISNTTIPKTHKAVWSQDGTGVFLQYFTDTNNTLRTTFLDIGNKATANTATTSATSTSPEQLIPGIADIAVRAGRAAWIRETSDGAVLETSSLDSLRPTPVFVSALHEWDIEWAGADTLLLTSEPAAGVRGFLYELNIESSRLTPVLRDVPGLITNANSTGNRIIFSRSTAESIGLRVHTRSEDAAAESILTQTLPVKGVWGDQDPALIYCGVPQEIPSGAYPDDWYQGEVAFSDTLQSFNTTTGDSKMIYNPTESFGESVDMVRPQLTAGERYLIVQNKTDGTLWRLRM